MAVNDPIYSYGESKLFKSNGLTVGASDIYWTYGQVAILHEFTAVPAPPVIDAIDTSINALTAARTITVLTARNITALTASRTIKDL